MNKIDIIRYIYKGKEEAEYLTWRNDLKKTTILILIVIIIAIIIAIIFSLILLNEKKQETLIIEEQDTELTIENNIIPIRNEEDFFTIEKIMSNYYLYVSVENKSALMNILTENYKSKNSITEDNIEEKVQEISGSGDNFFTREIYYKDDLTNPKYLVYGIIEKDKEPMESYAIIYINNETSSYAIEPITEELYNMYKQEEIEIPTLQSIERKEYNSYIKVTITQEEIINKYFESYVRDTIYYTQYAYSKLEEEYKNAKFPTIQDYQMYINNKSEELKSFLAEEMKTKEDFQTTEEYMDYLYNYEAKGVDKYRIDIKDDYTQYTIIDSNGNYYIMRFTSPMDYTIILDTYTIDLPEFIEQYQSVDDAGKVQLNIQRFFDAINDGDYKYAYNKLDQTYRNNNFPTQADFENYMKTTFYSQNKLGYTSYEKNGDLYIYKMVITNADNETQTIEKQFVVKLLEGTDFVMSFEK